MSNSAVEREFEFTQQDFKLLGDLVTKHAGIIVVPEKFDMFYSRLARRVRALNLTNFKQYCDLLTSGEQGEFHNFINAITTNLTSFFRENHHFEFLKNTIIPELLVKNAASSKIRIWSAGCSTGEEPYSLAITLKEALQQHRHWDVKILATDIDSNVLETASTGLYKEDRIAGLSPERKSKWFLKGKGQNAGMVSVLPELKEMTSFKRLNLMDVSWPMKGPFDIIFCRNVVIYFDRETKEALVDRYTDLLTSQGYLLIGHSESLNKANTRLKLLGNTIYRKVQ